MPELQLAAESEPSPACTNYTLLLLPRLVLVLLLLLLLLPVVLLLPLLLRRHKAVSIRNSREALSKAPGLNFSRSCQSSSK